jgi:hypothetical protein
MVGTRQRGALTLVPSNRIVWHNPCGDGDPLGEPCEVLEGFEVDGCAYYLVLFSDGEQMVVLSDELDLDCHDAARKPASKKAPDSSSAPARAA